MGKHGYGQSEQGKNKRVDKWNNKFDKWIETCLRVNQKIESKNEVNNVESTKM